MTKKIFEMQIPVHIMIYLFKLYIALVFFSLLPK